ncbi:MAG TPA: amidohydrolase family protein [Terriglobales bacterium]|nr:amidohydrolase family protein [Terriglobales bacterium]
MKSLLAFLVAATTALVGQVKVGATAQTLVLTNITVIDTRSAQTLPHVTIVVKDGIIQAVAKVGLIDSTPHTQIVNGNGKYVIPGLWDMHVHSAGGPAKPWDEKIILPLYLANGITGIRDMGGDPAILEERRKKIDAGELAGPHMYIAGPFLNGGKSDAQTIAVNTPDEARQAVDSLKARGMDFIKILSNISPGVYWPLAEEAKLQHIHFVGHVPTGVSVAEASMMGQKSIEHLSGVLLATSSKETQLRQQILEAIDKKDWAAYSHAMGEARDTYSQPKAWDLFSEFVDNCTWQVPTLVWDVAAANVDNPAASDDPRMKYVPKSVAKSWDPAKLAQETGADQLAQAKKETAHYMQLVDLMRRAGVLMMAGTDSPDPFVFPGFSLHDELELLVKSGLSNMQALQAATFYPALFMTKLNRYGVVETGHVADIVVLDDDPLKDIANTRKISAVIVRGKYYGRTDLDKMLADVAAIASTE